MTKGMAVDMIAAFVLGLAVLSVASSVVLGLIVLPIEASSDNHSSWSTLSFTIGGRFFTLLGTLESILVLALVAVLAAWARRLAERLPGT